MQELLLQYINTLKTYSTQVNYSIALRDFAKTFKNLEDILPKKLERYKIKLLKKKAEQTVNARLAAIRGFLDFLWTKGLVASNPAANIKNNVVKKYSYSKNVSLRDFRKIIQETNSTLKGLRDCLLLRLIFHYGSADQVLNFKWDQPMPSPRLAKIKTKLEESAKRLMRRLFKNDPYLAQQNLEQLKKGYLFFSFETRLPQAKLPITVDGTRKLLQHYCLSAGFPTNFADFRALKRLRAKEIYKKTKSVEQVQRFCGHKDIKVTKEYIKKEISR